MQFTATFLGLVLLLSGVSALPSLKDSCGVDAQVIGKNTRITPSGKELTFTTTSCPGFAALRNATITPSIVHKRQIRPCSFTCNAVQCNFTVAQPAVADCASLTAALVELDEDFTAPPQTQTQIEFQTCLYTYFNMDTITYDVCTGGFGVLGEIAVTDCLDDVTPETTAGSCFSIRVSPGNDWVVEAGHS